MRRSSVTVNGDDEPAANIICDSEEAPNLEGPVPARALPQSHRSNPALAVSFVAISKICCFSNGGREVVGGIAFRLPRKLKALGTPFATLKLELDNGHPCPDRIRQADCFDDQACVVRTRAERNEEHLVFVMIQNRIKTCFKRGGAKIVQRTFENGILQPNAKTFKNSRDLPQPLRRVKNAKVGALALRAFGDRPFCKRTVGDLLPRRAAETMLPKKPSGLVGSGKFHACCE